MEVERRFCCHEETRLDADERRNEEARKSVEAERKRIEDAKAEIAKKRAFFGADGPGSAI